MAEETWKEMFGSIWKERGGITFIQFLLDAGLDVNALNKYGKTMLNYAAEWGNVEITDFLVSKGADSNFANSDGSKPLHIAAQHGRKDIVKFFLNKGISIDSCDTNKCTALHYIAKSNITSVSRESCQEILNFLVNSNADINAVNRNGCTPLLLAARNFRKHIVEMLIKLGANVDCCDNDQWAILHYSSMNGWCGIVRSLVEGRFDIDLNARLLEGDTPLILASKRVYKDIVELLIKSGANIDCCDEDQRTVLHYSCSNGWLSTVKYLVTKGCGLNTKDNSGCTPLLLAARNAYCNIVEYLIESGADVEGCGENGCSVLHYACSKGWLNVVESLIKKKCYLNYKNVQHDTPFHFAVRARNKKIVECLLEARADWNLENNSGKTALNKFIQSSFCYLEGILLFIKRGAYFQSSDYNIIIKKKVLKKAILQDTKLCTQVIINQFNNADLPKIYKIHAVAERLPPIEILKIASQGDVAQDIADSVKYKIQTKGFCNVLEARPIVLSFICLRSLVKYYGN